MSGFLASLATPLLERMVWGATDAWKADTSLVILESCVCWDKVVWYVLWSWATKHLLDLIAYVVKSNLRWHYRNDVCQTIIETWFACRVHIGSQSWLRPIKTQPPSLGFNRSHEPNSGTWCALCQHVKSQSGFDQFCVRSVSTILSNEMFHTEQIIKRQHKGAFLFHSHKLLCFHVCGTLNKPGHAEPFKEAMLLIITFLSRGAARVAKILLKRA